MSSSADLVKVQPEDVGAAVGNESVAALLFRFVEHEGNLHVDDIEQAARSGRMQMWVATAEGGGFSMVALTEVRQQPRRKVCAIVGCVGQQMESWRPHIAGIEDWARQIGCDSMEIRGRKGWARVYPEYEQTGIILGKTL